MTTDLRTGTPVVSPDGERAVRPRRRVRPPLLAAAVGLVLLATVLVVWGFSKAADRSEVLMVTDVVEAGTPIPSAALSTTMVGVDEGVGRFYPAGTDLSGVVAATDLSPGDVLTPSLVVAAPEVPEGWREVGAVVRTGRFPTTVGVGDELVAVPIDADGDVPVAVVRSSVGEDGGLTSVLAAPGGEAATVAQWAATDRLALVRLP
jgi:hypothetical protein